MLSDVKMVTCSTDLTRNKQVLSGAWGYLMVGIGFLGEHMLRLGL